MAIQVSGTSVINDSRQLQNIASLDSTTAATIAAAGGVSSTVTTTSSVASVEFATPNTDKNYLLVWDKVTLGGTAGYMRWYWQAPGQTTWRGWNSGSSIYTLNGTSLITSSSSNIAYNGTHFISAGYYQVQCTCLITGANSGATGNYPMIDFTMHYVSSNNNELVQVRSTFVTNQGGLEFAKIKVDPYGPTIYNGSRFVMYEI